MVRTCSVKNPCPRQEVSMTYEVRRMVWYSHTFTSHPHMTMWVLSGTWSNLAKRAIINRTWSLSLVSRPLIMIVLNHMVWVDRFTMIVLIILGSRRYQFVLGTFPFMQSKTGKNTQGGTLPRRAQGRTQVLGYDSTWVVLIIMRVLAILFLLWQ